MRHYQLARWGVWGAISRPPTSLVRATTQKCRNVVIVLRIERAVALGARFAEAAAPRRRRRPRRAAGGAGRAREVEDLAAGLQLHLLLDEAGGDDGHPHLVLEARVEHGAEDDVGLLVRGLLNDAGGLFHLVDREVVSTGEVDEDALGALDGRVVQQRARDRLLRGIERAVRP